MDNTQELPNLVQPGPRPKRRWPRRVAIGAAFAITLGIGVGIGAATQNTGISQAKYSASQAQVSALKGQVSALNGTVSGLQAQAGTDSAAVATAQHKAATAQQSANASAAAAYKGRQAALQATYQGKEAALAQTQRTANQEATQLKQELGQVQANTISGDGVYVVGKDIKSGTWHTNGSGNTGQNDCYFATLNSTDTNNIADNNNFDGAETVDVSGAYAFEVSGPCTWILEP
jgi:hypothetical protein